jgi:hypothetical protein
MITLKMQGGLGNRLFQYCSARILAENSDLCLYSPRVDGFKKTKRIHLGKVVTSGFQKIGGHALPNYVNRRTLLEGYFQRIELLDAHRDKVTKWLEPSVLDPLIESKDSDLTLSIRRGSTGWPIELCPTMDYYLDLLKEFKFTKLWITTDSPKDEYFIPLLKKHPEAQIVELDVLGQFKFIQNSRRIIVAPSTFSILASWSSNAKNIYWPKIDALDFSKTEHNWYSHTDLRNRYIG